MTVAPRQHEIAARPARLTTAETIVVGPNGSPRGSKGEPGTRPVNASLPPAVATDGPWAVLRIERPGTYRLAADVLVGESSVGILIAADHVTLDLAGFSVVGKPGSLSGIRVVGARTNICVRNGSVRACGAHGVDMADATESSVEALRISDNAGDGLRLGANCIADKIVAWSNSRDGISAGNGAELRACTARANGGAGIILGDNAIARECTTLGNERNGLHTGAGSIVTSCVSRHNHGAGIVVGDVGSIRGCEIMHNDADAARAGTDSLITDTHCVSRS